MFIQLLIQLLLMLKMINAAKYSVTIMNDSDYLDGQGLVHTWLVFNNGNNDVKYFSFENTYAAAIPSIAIGNEASGKCTDESDIKHKRPTESLTIPITEEQYNQLIEASRVFCSDPPNYELKPSFSAQVHLRLWFLKDVFNCVTASNKILQAARIGFLTLADTPSVVKQRINNGSIVPVVLESLGSSIPKMIKCVFGICIPGIID